MKIKWLTIMSLGGLLLCGGQAHATLTTYTDLASFQAAVGGSTTTETFDSTTPQNYGTPGSGAFLTGFNGFTASGDSNGDFVSVADGTQPSSINGTNHFYYSEVNPLTGNDQGDGNLGPTFTYTAPTQGTAFAFDWVDNDSTDSYQVTINGQTFTTPPFSVNGTDSGFFGVVGTSGETFDTVLFEQNASGGYVDTFGIDNVQFSAAAVPAAVPEPGTMSLLGIGLVGLVASRRRRKKEQADESQDDESATV